MLLVLLELLLLMMSLITGFESALDAYPLDPLTDQHVDPESEAQEMAEFAPDHSRISSGGRLDRDTPKCVPLVLALLLPSLQRSVGSYWRQSGEVIDVHRPKVRASIGILWCSPSLVLRRS